jgi:hypothetical protein
VRTATLLFLSGLVLFGWSGLTWAEEIETLDDIEDVSDAWYLNPQQFPVLDRFTSVFSATALRRGSVLLDFDHRVRQPLSDEPLHDFLGFDAGGLKIGIGFRYGIIANADIGLYRLNGTVEIFDTYEFDARYQLLHERTHGLSLALRGGVSWFVQPDIEDASGGFFQLLVDKTFAHRVRFGTGLLYHSESSGPDKATGDEAHSLAIPGMLALRLFPSLALVVETVSAVDGYYAAHPMVSIALKKITHGHTFSLLVSNSQYTSADGIITNSDTDFGDAAIGFTITRELD